MQEKAFPCINPVRSPVPSYAVDVVRQVDNLDVRPLLYTILMDKQGQRKIGMIVSFLYGNDPTVHVGISRCHWTSAWNHETAKAYAILRGIKWSLKEPGDILGRVRRMTKTFRPMLDDVARHVEYFTSHIDQLAPGLGQKGYKLDSWVYGLRHVITMWKFEERIKAQRKANEAERKILDEADRKAAIAERKTEKALRKKLVRAMKKEGFKPIGFTPPKAPAIVKPCPFPLLGDDLTTQIFGSLLHLIQLVEMSDASGGCAA